MDKGIIKFLISNKVCGKCGRLTYVIHHTHIIPHPLGENSFYQYFHITTNIGVDKRYLM